MALDPRMILQGAQTALAAGQSNPLGAIQQGQQLQQNLLQQQAQEQALLQAQQAAPLEQQLLQQRVQAGQLGLDRAVEQMDEETKGRSVAGMISLASEAGVLPIEQQAAFVRSRAKDLDIPGVADLSDFIVNASDQEILDAIPKLTQAGIQQGFIKATKDTSRFTGVEIDADSGQVIYTNTQTGETVTQPIGEFESRDMTPKDRREFQKETRASLRGDISRVKKDAQTLSSSRDKISSLIGQAQSGNRQAIAAVIMNLARLNSPGVVTDADFANIAGAQTPIAAALGLLQGKGVDVNTVMRGIDPTNPDNFDANAVIATADSLITSQLPTLNNALEGLREKSRIAGLPDKQVNTLFAGTDFIGDIQGLQESQDVAPIQVGKYKVEVVQ